MENENFPQPEPVIEKAPPPASEKQGLTPEQIKMLIIASGSVLLVLGIIGLAVWKLLQPTTPTAAIRDVFIIFMALESLLIGLVLIILVIQIARLINLLQNEIKPILDSTNETVSHLRGTTVFLSDNLVQPVIKMNEYLAGFSQLLQVIGLAKKSPKSKPTPRNKGE